MQALGKIALILALVAVVMYFAGWLIFQPRPDATGIEIKTGEMKEAAHDAAEKGRELWRDTKEKLESPREPVETDGATTTP